MSTAYVATAQTWAASPTLPNNLAVRRQQRHQAEGKSPSWQPPVALYVEFKFGICFGGGVPPEEETVTINYPPSLSKRTSRFLLTGLKPKQRTLSEQTRRSRDKSMPLPLGITPLNAKSMSRKQIKRQSSITPEESASQVAVPTTANAPIAAPPNTHESGMQPPMMATSHGAQLQLGNPPRPQQLPDRRPPRHWGGPAAPSMTKPLPNIPSSFRLGEAGMPWESSTNLNAAAAIANGSFQQIAPMSRTAGAAPGSGWPNHPDDYSYNIPQKPISTPDPPMVLPQSSSASLNRTLNRMASWETNSMGQAISRPTSSGQATPRRGVTPGRMESLAQRLRGVPRVVLDFPPPTPPPNIPLPPTPNTPSHPQASQTYVSIVTERRVLKMTHPPPSPETPRIKETADQLRQREDRELKEPILDPESAQEMVELNRAMVGFDGLDNRFSGTWEVSRDSPRTPISLGWAVGVNPPGEQEARAAEARQQREMEETPSRSLWKGKEPMIQDAMKVNHLTIVDELTPRPSITGSIVSSLQGSEGTGERTLRGQRSQEFYAPVADRQRQYGEWHVYSPDDWDNDHASSIWGGIERGRSWASWTSGPRLEWSGKYWTYK